MEAVSDEAFIAAVRKAVRDHGSPEAVARILKTSIPTVKRWAEGKSLAHPMARKSVIEYLGGVAQLHVDS